LKDAAGKWQQLLESHLRNIGRRCNHRRREMLLVEVTEEGKLRRPQKWQLVRRSTKVTAEAAMRAEADTTLHLRFSQKRKCFRRCDGRLGSTPSHKHDFSHKSEHAEVWKHSACAKLGRNIRIELGHFYHFILEFLELGFGRF